ncbi:MAG: hypothetical protein AAB370_11090 [Verrucomicrobiota bacterium]
MKVPSVQGEIDSFLTSCANGIIPLKGWIHPLGFVHVKALVNGNDDSKIRFRFWETGMDPAVIGKLDRIHNHAFDFTSFILCGAILEKRYEVLPASVGSHHIWEVDNLGGRSTLRKTGVACNVREVESISHISKASYTLAAGIYHDAVAVKNCTATLVFETPQPEIASLVICDKQTKRIASNPWPDVSRETIISLIRKVIGKRTMECGQAQMRG